MKYLLLPFSFLYGLITDIRNYWYDKGFLKEYNFDLPIINVGNLTVGGTGKTPHVEYLIRLLKDNFVITTLSRGYGRKTKGFILADTTVNSQIIGDEPYQFYQKFVSEIEVAVGENRVEAIIKILIHNPNNDLIILDDAFQHRAVKPSLNVLLIDYARPIYEDFTFPTGRLRERRHGAKRADAVIITKNPTELSIQKQREIENRLQPYLIQNTPIFFTKIKYGKPQNCRSGKEDITINKVVLLSGIANPKPFEEYVKTHFEVVNHLIYNDHHDYSERDLEEIVAKNNFSGTTILMTEKDMVKFIPFLNHELLKGVELYYLPIEIEFLNTDMKNNFDKLVMSHLRV